MISKRIEMARCRRGFTLIEVLVALVIFSIAVLGIQALMVGTVQGNAQARRVTAATNLAAGKLEELRNTPYANVLTGSDPSTLKEDGQPGGIYTRTWTVSAGPVANTKQLAVKVSWQDQINREVQLTTLLTNTNA